MSIQGRDILAQFEATHSALEGEIASLAASQRATAARADALLRERLQLQATFARVRVQALDDEQAGAALSDADRQVLDCLERRDRALATLEERIDANAREASRLATQRGHDHAAYEDARAQWETRFAAIRERLGSDRRWPLLLERAAALEAQAHTVRARLAQAEADRDEKRRAYEADPLFTYLWQRGHHRRQRGGPFGALDRWVAGLCDYPSSSRNFTALLALPDRLADHAARIEEALQAVVDEGRALEEAAIAADPGAAALRAAAEAAQRQLDATGAAMAVAAEDADRLDEERNALLAADNPFQREAELCMQAAVAAADAAGLQALARGTPSNEDDRAAWRLEAIEREQQEVTAAAQEQQQQHAALAERRRRLDHARAAFRRKHYDDGNSRFEKGFDVDGLLMAYLLGRMTGGDFFRRIDGAQHWDLGGLGGLGGGSRGGGGFGGGGFGGGGFSSGGGFGGGGFSSGGGF